MDPRLLRQKKRQQQLKRRRVLFFLGLSFLCLVLVFGTALYVFLNSFQPADADEPGNGGEIAGPSEYKKGERLNILLLGVDMDKTRTDTMILASLDMEKQKVDLISIPRDSRVEIPTRPGLDKINHAHAYGGPNLAMKTVENFLGIPVHHYIRINYQGFVDLIDILGGVEIDVEENMKYYDPYQNLNINIKAGHRTLDGKNALDYVRYRDDGLGDIGRIRRQQKFINALLDKVLSPSTVVKIIPLLDKVKELVNTEMSATEILKLANMARQIDRSNIKTHMIPGTDATIDGVSYWIPDQSGIKNLLASLENDGELENNEEKVKEDKQKELTRVRVLNGSGKSGIAAKVSKDLEAEGYEVVEVGNADNFDYRYTQVINYASDKTEAKKIAKIVGSKELITGEGNNNGADITIILGRDYAN